METLTVWSSGTVRTSADNRSDTAVHTTCTPESLMPTPVFAWTLNHLSLSPDALERWADSRHTSREVALAIHDVADGDADEAARIWDDPTSAEYDDVSERAWEMAESETRELHWGETTLLNYAPLYKLLRDAGIGDEEPIELTLEAAADPRYPSEELADDTARYYDEDGAEQRNEGIYAAVLEVCRLVRGAGVTPALHASRMPAVRRMGSDRLRRAAVDPRSVGP